ncbi:MAG: MFS transporter [Pseudomonadota bacterium]|nr:MFS transporter [Pseudomonadota bacterium]
MKNFSTRNIFYSLPAFSFAIPTFPVMIMLPAFFAEVHNFDIAVIGTYIFIAKLIDITSDPIVGWINDKKILDRKFLIIIGSILCSIGLYKLFIQKEINYDAYLLVWVSVLYLGWTLFQIPYLSVGYDLEKDYFLRTKLSADRELFILLGLFFSLGFPMFFNFSNAELLTYIVYIAIFSGLIGVSIMLYKIPDKRIKNKDLKLNGIFKNLKDNNLLLRVMLAWFINSLANVFPMILFSFYISYVLGGNDSDRQVVLFYYFLFAILGVPFWTYISKRFGKKKTWVSSLILSAFFFIFVLFLSEGDIHFFIIISCITGFCLGADLIIPPSIQADVSDIHLNKFNEDISGILFSLITFLNKLSFAIASLFVFTALGLLNFEANEEINFETKIFIICCYGLTPVLLKLLSSLILMSFTITEKDVKNVQKKIYG